MENFLQKIPVIIRMMIKSTMHSHKNPAGMGILCSQTLYSHTNQL